MFYAVNWTDKIESIVKANGQWQITLGKWVNTEQLVERGIGIKGKGNVNIHSVAKQLSSRYHLSSNEIVKGRVLEVNIEIDDHKFSVFNVYV